MPQNCILAGSVSVRFAYAILRNDDIYTRRRDLTFEFSPLSFQFSLFSSFVARVLFLIPVRCWGFTLYSGAISSLQNVRSAGVILPPAGSRGRLLMVMLLSRCSTIAPRVLFLIPVSQRVHFL